MRSSIQDTQGCVAATIGNGDAVTGWTEVLSYPTGNCFDISGATETDNNWGYSSVEEIAQADDSCDNVTWYALIYVSNTNTYPPQPTPPSSSVTPWAYDSYHDCAPPGQHLYDFFNEGVYDNYWSVPRWSGPY